MKPINECLADATPIESLTLEAAERVARAFCLQFYITASEDRSTITKYYGHESKFYLNDQTITGPQKIAESYNHLPERARFKINSVKGYPTLHSQGIIINVIGSVNFRPFVQSFLLGQQKQKTYYIESDAFQYVDNYFDFKLEQGCSLPVGLVEHPDSLNHNPTISKKYPEQSMTQPMSTMQMQQTPKKAKELPSPVEQDTSKVAEQDNSQKPEDVQHQPEQQQQLVAAPVQIPEVVQEQPKIPKTWASLVGGNIKQQFSQQPKYTQGRQTNQQHQMQATTPHQHQQMHPTQTYQLQRHPQQASQHPSKDFRQSQSNSDTSQNERKIYLGGITREIVPSNTAQAETEIKQVFYKYGQVEEVRMPRKVLDSPNDTSKHAFAFITMRNKAGVQSIFAAATRDEQGVWTLPLKLDAFGFDGYAQISEQRNQPLGGGTRGGRGGFQSRGNVSRGSPGGASYVFQKVLGSKMAANSREPTLSSSLTFM